MSLATEKCEACAAGAPAVEGDERARKLKEVPNWKVIDEDTEPKLERVFKFKNFVEALAFTNRVGEAAEEQNHHPALLTEWGKVTVRWWTHKIKNLHQNDFIMAARTDELASG
jgi:4a-hydroxytetrahydrobiopterin dehydratase